jgi:hypothetical protein
MRKVLIMFAVLVVAGAALAATVASGGPTVSNKKDKNTKVSAKGKKSADALAKSVYQQVSSTRTEVGSGPLCAIAVIPGPAGNFTIRFGVFNTTGGNTLDVLIVDSFFSLGGSSLLQESVSERLRPRVARSLSNIRALCQGLHRLRLARVGGVQHGSRHLRQPRVRGNGCRHGPHASRSSLLERTAVCRNPRLQRRLQRVDRNVDADVAVGSHDTRTSPRAASGCFVATWRCKGSVRSRLARVFQLAAVGTQRQLRQEGR